MLSKFFVKYEALPIEVCTFVGGGRSDPRHGGSLEKMETFLWNIFHAGATVGGTGEILSCIENHQNLWNQEMVSFHTFHGHVDEVWTTKIFENRKWFFFKLFMDMLIEFSPWQKLLCNHAFVCSLINAILIGCKQLQSFTPVIGW